MSLYHEVSFSTCSLHAGSGLPDHQREVVHQLAVGDFLGRLADRLGQLGVQYAERLVGARRRQFLDSQRPHQRRRHLLAADFDVCQGPLGLRAPVAVGRDGDLAHRVGFDACGGVGGRCGRHVGGVPDWLRRRGRETGRSLWAGADLAKPGSRLAASIDRSRLQPLIDVMVTEKYQ
jgi:hypothetical protein